MEKQANYKPFLTNSRSFRCGYTEDRTADRGGQPRTCQRSGSKIVIRRSAADMN